jgi:hypothetical protein
MSRVLTGSRLFPENPEVRLFPENPEVRHCMMIREGFGSLGFAYDLHRI